MSKLPFVAQLETSSTKPLKFIVEGRQLVPNDFHVTEIKRVSVESLDCGGGSSAWQELVIQLWSPRGDNTPQAMTAGKFAKILAKADALSLLGGEHVRFEYGAVGAPAVQYTLGRLNAAGDALELELIAPQVACKPTERSQMSELTVVAEGACCGPGASPAKVCCA